MMRYILFTLSAISCIGFFGCNSGSSGVTIKEMSAKFKQFSSDTGEVWKANPNLVSSTIQYKDAKGYAVLFSGSDYETLNTTLQIFVQDFKGEGTYPLYPAASNQSDSNYAKLVYKTKDFRTISGSIDVLRSTDDVYIADFEFTAAYKADTIAVTNGHFTISRTKK